MGPKAKGKGKGKKKGKKKAKKTPPPEPEKITKTQYHKWIAELNAILAAVRLQTEKVENHFFATEEKYEQRKIDLADVIQFLENEITDKENEIADFQERINLLTAELKAVDDYYEEIFAKMEEDYKEMKHKLTEQIDYINAKINALDEIRIQREEFLRKQAALFKLVAEQKARHKEEIYESEKQSIIQRDTMRKTMERKISQLTSDFREATDIRIGVATNKILRENVKLGNLLTCMQEMMRKMRKAYEKIKDNEKKSKYSLELKQDECEILMRKYDSHVTKIERLLKNHQEFTERIANFGNIIKQNKRLNRKINETDFDIKSTKEEIGRMYRLINDTTEKTLSGKENLNALKKKIVHFQEILYQAAKLTKKAIDIEQRLVSKKEPQGPGDDEEVEEEEEEHEGREGSEQEDEEEEPDEKAIMEMKMDRCYHTREGIIQLILQKLAQGLPTEEDRELMASWSESFELSFTISYQGSVPSLRRPRSSKISTITIGTATRIKETKKPTASLEI